MILYSAHSLPVKTVVTQNDPYPQHVEATVKAIDAALGNRFPSRLGYQSKVGPVEWLGPSTSEVLASLAKEGVKQVVVVPVAFVSDHVETLYEIRLLFAGEAARLGIPHYAVAEGLNDHPAFIRALAQHRDEGGLMKRVVILGGGIAGLTAAYRRKSEGETVVLEAGPAPGGSVKTVREDGFVVEGGPNTLRTSEAADRLLADLGLEPRVVKADPKAPRWIVRGGRPRAIVRRARRPLQHRLHDGRQAPPPQGAVRPRAPRRPRGRERGVVLRAALRARGRALRRGADGLGRLRGRPGHAVDAKRVPEALGGGRRSGKRHKGIS